MDIGIIGAGNIGATAARLWAGAGHRIALANSRGPDSLAGTISAIEGDVRAATVPEAAEFGEVVLVAIPLGRYEDLPPAPLAGKIVIDANNYYPGRDGAIAELDTGATSSSSLLQAHLSGSVVVKAINTVPSGRLAGEGRTAGDPERLAVPVAGGDEEAKRTVIALLDQMGFDGVDAGTLEDGGRRQQPGTPVYGAKMTSEQVRDALAAAG
jgi:predicted dinucleotide-binding enzyme